MRSPKYNYDIREIDAWNSPEGWTWNSSFHVGTMSTAAKNEKRAFSAFLARHGIKFKKNRIRIIDDGEIMEIQDRKTQEPLYAAIPNF